MRATVVFLLLAGAAHGCVVNGYGVKREEVCVLRFCNEGYEPARNNTECAPCEKGMFSDTQGLDACRPCNEMPLHSEPAFYGEKTPECSYRCHEDTFTTGCLRIYDVSWRVAFVGMTIVALVYLTQRHKNERKNR